MAHGVKRRSDSGVILRAAVMIHLSTNEGKKFFEKGKLKHFQQTQK